MSLRILIAVTHLLGAGHLTRAAALARAFAQAGHETVLVSGGTPIALPALGDVRFVQLPPVRTIGTDFRTLLDETGAPIADDRLSERRALLVETVTSARPHVIVTELFPFGRRVLAEEFDALLEAAHASVPRPLVLSSIRDILVAPTKPGRIAETHRRLARFYDGVLVHGDPVLASLDASWPVDDPLREMLHYTGYVDEGPEAKAVGTRTGIVVSGGSSAASLPLYGAALDAAHDIADRPWRILVGRGVADADMAGLAQRAAPHVTVERARPDFRSLLCRADLSISQAGYNTCVDLLRTGVRALLVPFEAGRETEQRLRAERLKTLGLADLISEEGLTGESLAAATRKSLATPLPAPTSLSLDGARRSVAIVENLAPAAPARHERLDWSPLGNALRRAGDSARPIRFWWRDDDAVAHTPQLDRLLDLANRFDAGIALACVPMGLEASLAERISGEARAFALVHGLSHANHAPEGEKKAEFGAHRPLKTLAAEAAEGLNRARDRLGGRLLPVFVPPWNRIAPTLIPALPSLGYVGLSTVKDRIAGTPTGLAIVNTHVDPIDWQGSRSLCDPASLIRSLADAIERRVSGRADPAEPIGFLTHHLVHDERIWIFCETLLMYLSRNDVSFASISKLFCDENRIVADT